MKTPNKKGKQKTTTAPLAFPESGVNELQFFPAEFFQV